DTSILREPAAVARIIVRLVQREARDKRRLLLSAAWPTCVLVEQCRKRLRVGNGISIEDPNPIETVLDGMSDAVSDGATDPDVLRVAKDGDPLGKLSVQGPIRRTVVDDDQAIRSTGLPFNSRDGPLYHRGLVKGVNVSQNAHGCRLRISNDTW